MLPIMELVGEPHKNSLYDDATKWWIKVRVSFEIQGDRMKFINVGAHGICTDFVEILCDKGDRNFIEQHNWDMAGDVYGDFSDILINTSQITYSWF
jgi:hypothetical protein